MSKPSTELTVSNKEEQALLASIQGDFNELVQVRRELKQVPRLKLNNPLSDAVKSGLGRSGDFTCSLLSANYGSSVTIIPLIVSESASLLDKESSDVICSSNDLIHNREGTLCRNCPHGEYWNNWGTKNNLKIPACKTSIDMIVVVVDPKTKEMQIATPMQVNFRKNNHKAGRTLINLIANDPKKIPFGQKYTLYSKEETKDKWDYYVVHSKRIDHVPLTLEEIKSLIPIAKQLIEWKKSGELQFAEDKENGSDLPV